MAYGHGAPCGILSAAALETAGRVLILAPLSSRGFLPSHSQANAEPAGGAAMADLPWYHDTES
jgi:hypothetical protein